jgi:hypothetical protein
MVKIMNCEERKKVVRNFVEWEGTNTEEDKEVGGEEGGHGPRELGVVGWGCTGFPGVVQDGTSRLVGWYVMAHYACLLPLLCYPLLLTRSWYVQRNLCK